MMQCPDCGSFIPEGHMYCDNCGREFNMVPDYEPEIDGQIDHTLTKLAGKIEEPEEAAQHRTSAHAGQRVSAHPQQRAANGARAHHAAAQGHAHANGNRRTTAHKESPKQLRQRKARQRKMLLIGGAALIGLVLLIVLISSLHQTAGDDISDAKRAYGRGDLSAAVSSLHSALEKDGKNSEAIFLLASYLRESGDLTAAVRELDAIVNSAAFSTEDTMRAYRETAEMLAESGDAVALQTLLERCPYEEIKALYVVDVPPAPVISPGGGTFEGTVTLTMTAEVGTEIYYTVNGAEPGPTDPVYKEPLTFSETGSYTVRALAMGPGGVESSLAVAEFVVEARLVEAPQVLKDSGFYGEATQITVVAQPGLEIRYTTEERKMPDAQSPLYTEPIDMPTGDSFFNFVCVDEHGTLSEVVSRQYHMEITRKVDEVQAIASVKTRLIQLGVLTDATGALPDREGILEFSVDRIVTIGNEGEFYYITEYYVPPGGAREGTGLFYAVNTQSGLTCRIGYDVQGQMFLNSF